MLSTRRGTALIAAACTVVAAGVLLFAAGRYRHSVNQTAQPEIVFVASSLIQKGTPGDVIASGNMFRSEKIATKQVATGAIADSTLLHGKVAARDIQPGQQLTLSDFTANGGYAAQLAPKQRAISVSVDTSHGLSGVLQAGDRVDVYAGVSASSNGSTSGGTGAGAALRLLMPNVPVMAVNLNGNGGVGSGSVNSQADVVLKINAADAGALAFASDNGKIWLVLRGANAVEPRTQNQALYTLNSLLLGAKPAGAGR
jgi:Flp pilus assembly protein CpaB